jgi:hypothetical protein
MCCGDKRIALKAEQKKTVAETQRVRGAQAAAASRPEQPPVASGHRVGYVK